MLGLIFLYEDLSSKDEEKDYGNIHLSSHEDVKSCLLASLGSHTLMRLETISSHAVVFQDIERKEMFTILYDCILDNDYLESICEVISDNSSYSIDDIYSSILTQPFKKGTLNTVAVY